MPAATIVTAYKDATSAYATARVAEGGARGNVEYGPASTPLKKDDGTDKTNAELKADLTAALKAVRDAQVATTTTLPVSGAITL